MSRYRVPRECVRCERVRPHMAKGLCTACYANDRRGPYVPTGIGPGAPGLPKSREVVTSRLEEFAALRAMRDAAGQPLHSIAVAARRVGVSQRTGDRYEARLREQVVA